MALCVTALMRQWRISVTYWYTCNKGWSSCHNLKLQNMNGCSTMGTAYDHYYNVVFFFIRHWISFSWRFWPSQRHPSILLYPEHRLSNLTKVLYDIVLPSILESSFWSVG